jgi:hypothetical protein
VSSSGELDTEVDEPGSYSTDMDAEGLPGGGLEEGAGRKKGLVSASKIRRALSEGGAGTLRVVASLSSHRDVKGSKDKVVTGALTLYPDVLKVVNIYNNAVFHFAPAVSLNLPELAAFGHQGGISSDQVRVAGSRCPHPLLPLLSAATSPSPLASVYCLSVMSLSPKTSTDVSSSSLLSPHSDWVLCYYTACLSHMNVFATI